MIKEYKILEIIETNEDLIHSLIEFLKDDPIEGKRIELYKISLDFFKETLLNISFLIKSDFSHTKLDNISCVSNIWKKYRWNRKIYKFAYDTIKCIINEHNKVKIENLLEIHDEIVDGIENIYNKDLKKMNRQFEKFKEESNG